MCFFGSEKIRSALIALTVGEGSLVHWVVGCCPLGRAEKRSAFRRRTDEQDASVVVSSRIPPLRYAFPPYPTDNSQRDKSDTKTCDFLV